MNRRTQEELLEILNMLRQQLGPAGVVVPVGSVRYHPSAVIVSGYFYPLGLAARVLANPETWHADLSSPSVLVCNSPLFESVQLRDGIVPVLEHLGGKARRSLAVLATDIDGVVLEALVGSHQRNISTVAAIGCAGLEAQEGEMYLRTIARLCGATVLEPDVQNGAAWVGALGSARRVIADYRRTVIIEPARLAQAEFVPQPIGLLSVGGKDAQEVREGLEWLEGLIGH